MSRFQEGQQEGQGETRRAQHSIWGKAIDWNNPPPHLADLVNKRARELAEDRLDDLENQRLLAQSDTRDVLAPYVPPPFVRLPPVSAPVSGSAPVQAGRVQDAASCGPLSGTPRQLGFSGLAGGASNGMGGGVHQGVVFPGFPYLSNLCLEGDYINICRGLADGVMRTFGAWRLAETRRPSKAVPGKESKSAGQSPLHREEQLADKLDQLNVALAKFDMAGVLHRLLLDDSRYGIGFAVMRDRNGQPISSGQPKKGELDGFTAIDPVWSSPAGYDTQNPISPDYYRVSKWYFNGVQAEAGAVLSLVTRPVSDIWKPAYNFAGVSLALMCKTYIDNYRRDRDNVSGLLATMRTTVLKTNLENVLAPDGRVNLRARLNGFNRTRNNYGVMGLAKNEEFQHVNTPLGGLAQLLSQSQEQIASIARLTIAEFTGNQPQGLNASSRELLRLSNDRKMDIRKLHLFPLLERATTAIQHHLWGRVVFQPGDIFFEWEPLDTQTPQELADNARATADAMARCVGAGLLTAQQATEALIAARNSLFTSVRFEEKTGEDKPAPGNAAGAEGAGPGLAGEAGKKGTPSSVVSASGQQAAPRGQALQQQAQRQQAQLQQTQIQAQADGENEGAQQ